MKRKLIDIKNYNPELYRTLIIVWGISVGLCLLLLSLVFLIDQDYILSRIPTCPSQLQNKECILCGASRAFFEIKNLNFAKAFQLNKLSLFIFLSFLLNIIIFIKYIINRYKSKIIYENC